MFLIKLLIAVENLINDVNLWDLIMVENPHFSDSELTIPSLFIATENHKPLIFFLKRIEENVTSSNNELPTRCLTLQL